MNRRQMLLGTLAAAAATQLPGVEPAKPLDFSQYVAYTVNNRGEIVELNAFMDDPDYEERLAAAKAP